MAKPMAVIANEGFLLSLGVRQERNAIISTAGKTVIGSPNPRGAKHFGLP
jgi:hypothetical protein